jgi:hypothetical protein
MREALLSSPLSPSIKALTCGFAGFRRVGEPALRDILGRQRREKCT